MEALEVPINQSLIALEYTDRLTSMVHCRSHHCTYGSVHSWRIPS